MNKASVMNAVTVAAYAAMAVYALVVVVVLGLLVTGGFNKFNGVAEALKFDSMAVSISDNEGSAKLSIVSNNSTTSLNTISGGFSYNDPSNPITLKLELRDSAEVDAKTITPDKAIIEIPSTVILGQSFEIKAIKDADGFNKGGDCYIHAFSENDEMRATPIHIFVDVPIQSATLMYYNVSDNLNENYKRIETANNGDKTLTTTLFYNTYTDYLNKTNAIVPLNREQITDGESKKYIEKELTCVKNDKFQLYVQVYPERALNPHSIKTMKSSVILNNLDSAGLANVCTLLADAYANVSENEEAIDSYVEMFSTTWVKLGLNGLSNLDGLINKEKINQAVAKIRGIDAVAIWQYYTQNLGTQITFNNKEISFETPMRSVAEVVADNILEIKQTPQDNQSLIDVDVQAVYGASVGNVKLFNQSISSETTVNVNEVSNFIIKDAYFEGLSFDTDITKDGVSGRLSVPLNVGASRLIVSAQQLSSQDIQTLLQSTSNDYTQAELNNAVNLGIVIQTSGNNQQSNPYPLISEMKNLVLTQVSTNESVLPLTITPDTTLGDNNIIWLVTPNRRLEDGEGLSLSLSLTQEIKVENLNATDSANLGLGEFIYSEESDCFNNVKYKSADSAVAQKTSTVKDLGFTIEIKTPALQYQKQVNLKIEKHDYDGGNTNYEINGQPTGYVNVNSLITSVDGVEGAVFNPLNYTYGKIVYFASYEGENPIDKNVINVTSNTEGTQFYGQLLYSFATANSNDIYNYIQGMGAGSVIVTPYLVMTERKNGEEYAIDNSYNKIENLAEAELSRFVQVRKYDSILVTVTEEITKFHYYTNSNFKAENEYLGATDDKFFATGDSNMRTFYIRANSNLALPGSTEEYSKLGYVYNYKVWVGSKEVNSEVILEYPEQIVNTGDNQSIVSKQFDNNEGINYMAINLTVNPLKIKGNKTYTIKWYQGSIEVPNSTLEINAKDYYGDTTSMSFKSDELLTEKEDAYKATFTPNENGARGEYKVKWTDSQSTYEKFNLPSLYCIEKQPTEGETWNYIQSKVYLSQCQTSIYIDESQNQIVQYIPNYDTSYYWLLKDDTNYRKSTNALTNSEAGHMLTFSVEDDKNCLYIKASLPTEKEGLSVAGIVVSYTYKSEIVDLPAGTVVASCDYLLKLDWPVSFVYGTPDNWTLTGNTINASIKYLTATYADGETVVLTPDVSVKTTGIIGGDNGVYGTEKVDFSLGYNGTPAQLANLDKIKFNRNVKLLFTILGSSGTAVDITYVGTVTVSKA